MSDLATRRHASRPRAVPDPETLGRLQPASAATYLVRTGWARMGERSAGTVWTRRFDGSVCHLFQPEDPTSPDYALRMGEMITALALAEDRSELAILTDLHAADHGAAAATAERESRTAGRTDWMEPEYGLRRPELALVLDLAACRIEREAFVRALQLLAWPSGHADELADLVCECEVTAAESAPATAKPEERGDELG
jgi:hypothetical protein